MVCIALTAFDLRQLRPFDLRALGAVRFVELYTRGADVPPEPQPVRLGLWQPCTLNAAMGESWLALSLR